MSSAPEAAVRRDAFIERLFQSASGTFTLFTVYLGDRLGYYRTLAEDGRMTSTELAARTGTHERYAREWLEQQTVAGILEVDDPAVPAQERRYRLPLGHDEVLVDRESLNYLAPLAQIVVGAVHPLPSLLDAFRSGGGVHYEEYGVDLREGQAAFNRAMFLRQLGQEWLPAIPDVHARLQADPPARVADVGCGAGWSSIGIARCYPQARVDGFDLDAPSIDLALANARDAGLGDRVRFHVRDAGDLEFAGQYDLVIALECIHDMSDPVSALRAMRRMARDSGAVVVVDERVNDGFLSGEQELEWYFYGFSVLHCLPVGMAEQPSAGTGTVMRTDTLRRYALDAGFGAVEVLPIENPFFRFYRLMR